MNTIVIYRSNAGHTKEYALSIAKGLGTKAISDKEAAKEELCNYQVIVFGGWIRASEIVGCKKILSNLPAGLQQKIVIFGVGANKESVENTRELIERNIKNLQVEYPLFYLQGGLDPDKLSLPLRMMLNGVAKSIKKKQSKDPSTLTEKDLEFLAFFEKKQENLDEKKMETIVDYIKNM